MATFSERLTEAITAAGMTDDQLGNIAGGIDISTLPTDPTILLIRRLARALGVLPAWLAGWIDSGGPNE